MYQQKQGAGGVKCANENIFSRERMAKRGGLGLLMGVASDQARLTSTVWVIIRTIVKFSITPCRPISWCAAADFWSEKINVSRTPSLANDVVGTTVTSSVNPRQFIIIIRKVQGGRSCCFCDGTHVGSISQSVNLPGFA